MGRIRAILPKLVCLAVLLGTSGCANLRFPAIDPSGGRLFLPNPNYTTLARDGLLSRLHQGRLAGPAIGIPLPGPYEPALLNRHRQGLTSLLDHTGNTLSRLHENKHRWLGGLHDGPCLFRNRSRTPASLFGNLAYPRTPIPPRCGPGGTAPPGGPCYPVGSPSASSLSATLPGSSARVGTGLNSKCRGYDSESGYGASRLAQVGPGVVLAQPRYTARVGEEVIVLGAIAAKSGIARGGEPVKWSLSNDSVGTIVDAARPATKRPRLFGLLRQASMSRADCGSCVDSITSDRCRIVPRSPCDKQDDLYLSKGQTWVSLTSGSPGQSFITLAAPQLSCGKRVATAIIDWTDATWECPQPVLASLERGQLITRVFRNTDRTPIPNWKVRYTYIDGPKVSFENADSNAIDVNTDAQGRAILDVTPSGTEPGTTRFAIQIYDPELPTQAVHQCIGYITWSESTPVGQDFEYPEEPTEPGPPPFGDEVDDMTVAEPPFTTPTITPPRDITSTPPRDEPAPREDPLIRTEPERTRLSVRVRGPESATVGQRITYQIEVENTGNVPAIDATVYATEPRRGLRSIQRSVSNPLKGEGYLIWRIGNLEPGRPFRFDAEFEVLDMVTPELLFEANAENAFNPVTRPIRTEVIPRDLVKVRLSPPQPFAPEVGEGVAYNVAVDNRTNRPLSVRLIIRDWTPGLKPLTSGAADAPNPQTGIQFPDGIVIPPRGQSRPVPLPFETLRAGPQQFAVIATVDDPQFPNAQPDQEIGRLNVKESVGPVSFSPPPPAQIEAGQQDSIRINVYNNQQTPLTNVILTYRGSRNLYPISNSTPGFTPQDDGLTYRWNLGTLEPGAGSTIVVGIEASRQPNRRTGVNTVFLESTEMVLSGGGERIEIPIVNPRNSLLKRDLKTRPVGIQSLGPRVRSTTTSESNALKASLTMEDLGGETKVAVRLENRNQDSFRDISVTISVPPNIKILNHQAPPTDRPKVSADGQHLEFGKLREILPQEQLSFRVNLNTRDQGKGKIVARVEGVGIRRPIVLTRDLAK